MLVAKHGICHISTSDVFREVIAQGSELSRKIERFVIEGRLVPDPIVIDIVVERLNNPSCKKGFILDGFPRTIGQVEFLEGYAQQKNKEIDMVIILNIDKEEMFKRSYGRRRIDDKSKEALKMRLKVYQTETKAVITYYNEKGLLFVVDGIGSITEIQHNLYRLIQERLK